MPHRCLPKRPAWAPSLATLVLCLVLPGCGSAPSPADAAPGSASSAPAPSSAATSRLGPLLGLRSGGDGDSWRATNGVEYRMGLINTPETDECGGSTATAYRKRALAAGFYAQPYAKDRYGRAVAVIYTSTGANLNVDMARRGLANDRYLARLRGENPDLARQLDAAFAEAKAARRGVWGACPAARP